MTDACITYLCYLFALRYLSGYGVFETSNSIQINQYYINVPGNVSVFILFDSVRLVS
jgi:hypothetical protein